MDFPTAEQDHVIPHTSDLSGEAPTVAITTGLLPTASQHCTRCGATLAADQRYCVDCGERRGEPRLPFMDGRTTPASAGTSAPVALAAPVAVVPEKRSRFSPSSTLVAGTATLVLALGVGVLIGNAGHDDSSSAAAPPVQVVTVPTGGGTAAPATTTAADTTAGTAKTAAKGKGAAAKAADTKAAAAKAAAAKKAVSTPTGEAIPQAKTPVVKAGSKGSGPGYKDGKFTGDFFGG